MSQTNHDSAYYEGLLAYETDLTLFDCPYLGEDGRIALWADGWAAAFAADRAEDHLP